MTEGYYCTLTIKCRTREDAEKIINATCKKLIENKIDGIDWDLEVEI